MATPIASWNVTYTDADGQRQRATGLADWDAAQAEAKRLRANGARRVKTHPQFATLSDTFAYVNREAIARIADAEAAQEAREATRSLFIPELDGDTFATKEALADWHWDRQAELYANEFDPDAAYERHLETNDQYRWEVEEDERRAAALSAAFDAWQDRVWGAV